MTSKALQQTRPFGIIKSVLDVDDYTTTVNTYENVYSWDTEFLQGKVLRFSAATNDLHVKILGSVDGGATYPITAEAEFTVAVATPVVKRISNYYSFLKIQVKPAVGGSHGVLTTTGSGSSIPDFSDIEVTVAPTITVMATDLDIRDLTSTDVVTVTGGAGQTADVKISLDSEKVAISGIDAGTNFIGRTGAAGFKILQTFTRPNDITAYTAGDAITNSTSSPAIMSQDLAVYGATAARFLAITNARVVSSVKGSGLSCNIWIFPATFSATNDNSELSIDDTTAALGGIVIPCNNNYTTAVNSRAVSDPGYWECQLGAASTTLYFCLQAVNGYTPTANEVFTVIMEGFFL